MASEHQIRMDVDRDIKQEPGTAIAELTLLDYFMAHAPAEPADWFEPPQKTIEPPAVSLRSYLTTRRDCFYTSRLAELQSLADDWRRDACYDLVDGIAYTSAEKTLLAAYQKAWSEYWMTLQDAERERRKQRAIRWPYAWAAEQIALRKSMGITHTGGKE